MNALILVDLQNDFFSGGSLAVKDANQVLPIISQLLSFPFDYIIATKDWHPSDHGSFAATHGKQPGDHIILKNLDQILWPVHCVQNSHGSEFVSGWDKKKVNKVFYKGTDKMIDSYSTFFDNGHVKSTGLEKFLKEKGINEIYIAGVATDYCVKFSVLDALKLGFKPFVIVDACKGVNLQPNDSKKALQEMEQNGAILIDSKNLFTKK